MKVLESPCQEEGGDVSQEVAPSRRERMRAQAKQEAKQIAFEQLGGADARPHRGELHRQFTALLAERGQSAIDPAVFQRAIVVWSRLHGLISLEVVGQFGPMGFDPALLYRAEVEAMLSEPW